MLPKLAFAAVVSAAAAEPQSLAEPINRELPQWLRAGGEYRARMEGIGNRGFAGGQDDSYLLNRIRIDIGIKPAPWLKFFFQGQDARIYFSQLVPPAPPNQNHMDLRMGYMELGSPDKGPFGLRAGRQEINFGDQRLVGSSNWANNARTFDAVRATLRYQGWRLDAFAASVVAFNPNGFDRPNTGDNLHGLYGGIEKLVPQATIEPYLFWRLSPRLTAENGTRANLDLKTIGTRWVGKLPPRFDYALEMALQTGSPGPDDVRAWGGHWVVGHTLSAGRWQPRLAAEYNFATGDRNANDDIRGTFDTSIPRRTRSTGYATR